MAEKADKLIVVFGVDPEVIWPVVNISTRAIRWASTPEKKESGMLALERATRAPGATTATQDARRVGS